MQDIRIAAQHALVHARNYVPVGGAIIDQLFAAVEGRHHRRRSRALGPSLVPTIYSVQTAGSLNGITATRPTATSIVSILAHLSPRLLVLFR
jgi:hypothetical protein